MKTPNWKKWKDIPLGFLFADLSLVGCVAGGLASFLYTFTTAFAVSWGWYYVVCLCLVLSDYVLFSRSFVWR
jgi:hypothetical protein